MDTSNLDSLFENGKIEFQTISSGKEWTLSATGDYAPLPVLQKTIDQNRFDELMDNISALTEADISITNLEVALCEECEVNGKGVRGPRGLFAEMHQKVPFTIYSLANNHIRDAGPEALEKTFKTFKDQGIKYVGGGVDEAEAAKLMIISSNDIEAGVLAFAQNENQIATDLTPWANELIADKVLADAKKLVNAVDVPIVILHEGFEFMDVPRLQLRKLCRELVDLGIKLVIAHHPHVPQGIEKIGDSMVYYSLGNFLFTQPHFAPYPWARRSFVPKISFRGNEIAGVTLNTFELEVEPSLFLKPASEQIEKEILEHLRKNSAIIDDDALMKMEIEKFFSSILLPEFLGFIQRYSNEKNGDFSELIETFKNQIPVHNLFTDFVEINS